MPELVHAASKQAFERSLAARLSLLSCSFSGLLITFSLPASAVFWLQLLRESSDSPSYGNRLLVCKFLCSFSVLSIAALCLRLYTFWSFLYFAPRIFASPMVSPSFGQERYCFYCAQTLETPGDALQAPRQTLQSMQPVHYGSIRGSGFALGLFPDPSLKRQLEDCVTGVQTLFDVVEVDFEVEANEGLFDEFYYYASRGILAACGVLRFDLCH